MKIVIDGNIGSGKTTQLGLLEKKGLQVRREPIDDWPLEEFYKDPSRWAYLLHMRILQTLRPVRSERPVIYERSLLSSRWVFWPVLQSQGRVTPAEHTSYDQFYEQNAWYPDLYIFLSKDVEKAYEHVTKRGQAGDSGVTLEYMKELDEAYRKLLMKVPCKVHVLNANRSVEEIHEEICRILAENELFFGDGFGNKVQKDRRPRRQVPCTPLTDVCRLS
jgi:deoxyadenosine/deoxycytidine kinase